MKAIRLISTLTLLAAFLFSTTGVSVLHHFCRMGGHDNVVFYPGIFQEEESSDCCQSAEGHCGCSHQAQHHDSDPAPGLSGPPCCSTSHSFYKVDNPVLRPGQTEADAPDATVNELSQDATLHSVSAGKDLIVLPGDLFPGSPPTSGGVTLVLFLHQIKIPADPAIA